MKPFIACLSMLMLVVSSSTFVSAQEEVKNKERKGRGNQKAALKQYTVVGIVESKEVKKKEGETRLVYSITDDDGKSYILQSKGKKDEGFGQYVGKKVKLEGKGVVLLRKVTSIEVVD